MKRSVITDGFFDFKKNYFHLRNAILKVIIRSAGSKKQLVELVQHNRLSHALLFLGKEGNGSLQLALL